MMPWPPGRGRGPGNRSVGPSPRRTRRGSCANTTSCRPGASAARCCAGKGFIPPISTAGGKHAMPARGMAWRISLPGRPGRSAEAVENERLRKENEKLTAELTRTSAAFEVVEKRTRSWSCSPRARTQTPSGTSDRHGRRRAGAFHLGEKGVRAAREITGDAAPPAQPGTAGGKGSRRAAGTASGGADRGRAGRAAGRAGQRAVRGQVPGPGVCHLARRGHLPGLHPHHVPGDDARGPGPRAPRPGRPSAPGPARAGRRRPGPGSGPGTSPN